MFGPEFRVLFQEVNNAEIFPVIDQYLMDIVIYYAVELVLSSLIILVSWRLLVEIDEIVDIDKIWTSVLTLGNHWLELLLIVSSITVAVLLIMTFIGLSNVIEKSFEKLKVEIEKKDEQIKELELKLMEVTNVNQEQANKQPMGKDV